MQNIQRILKIAVQIISGMMALFVFGTVFFTHIAKDGVVYDFTNRVLLEDYVSNWFFIIPILGLCYFWLKKNYGTKDVFVSNKWQIQLLIASIILFVIQVWFLYHIYFYAGYDAFNLRTAAEYFVSGNIDYVYNIEYFQACPNNLMAYMFYIFVYYVANWFGVEGYILLLGCNIILTNIAVVLSALTAYKLTESKRILWLVYGMAVLLFGITPWLSVPYTDVFSITTPIFIFYLYLCLREKEIHTFIKWFCIIFLSLIMYDIKPLNVIILISICLCELLYFNVTKRSFKQLVIFSLAFILALGGRVSIRAGIEEYVGYVPNEDKVFGMDWVLYLGSDYSTYGQWSYDSAQYALQFETKEERREGLLEVTVERLTDMGVTGYVSHLMNKTHVFYNDGNIGWGATGGVIYEMPEKDNDFSKFLCNVIYPPENYYVVTNHPGYGAYFIYYAIVKQIIWLCVLCFMIIGICRPTKEKDVLILKVAWIGVFLFTMLFETHARLLISFLPVFVVIAGVGASNLSYKYNEKEES